MKENELYRALNASITGCQPSDYWKNHMVRQIVKGEEMKKRTKLSLGAIIVAALLLIFVLILCFIFYFCVLILCFFYYKIKPTTKRKECFDQSLLW